MSLVQIALFLISLSLCSQLTLTVELKYALFIATEGFDASGAVPAIELAEEMVNSNGSVLPGYTLSHTGVRDTKCMRTRSLDLYFEVTAAPNPPFLGLIGCGCSVASTPVAEIIHHESLSQIAFASSSIELDQRQRFRNFFRTQPSDIEFTPILTALIQLFEWGRVGFLNQNEALFIETFERIEEPLAEMGVTTRSRLIPNEGPIIFDSNFFFEDQDYRVFFVNAFSNRAQHIICEAFKRGYTYPRYTFIFYGWYVDNWWTQQQNPSSIDCTDSQLAEFLHRHLSIIVFAVTTDENAMTDTGLTAREFDMLYPQRFDNTTYTISYIGTLAYDTLWTLAFALDNTNRMLVNMTREEILDTTGCVGVNPLTNITWELVSLENFTYDNMLMGCVIRWNLQRTDFKGVSGQVQFSEVGGRFQAHSQVFQYRSTENGGAQQEFIALTDLKENQTTIVYVNNESLATVFPDGIPPDGTPINQINTFHLALVVIYYILAALGVLFSTACLIFNFTQRNKKVVRLTSPNLNYFLIIGTYVMYISVFLRLLPSTTFEFEAMVDIIGYCLAFGVILVKMGRIYYIFSDPTSYKTAIKDWHLIVISVSIALFGGLLALVQVAVPEFRPIPEKVNDEVLGTGVNADGVKINYMVYSCVSQEMAWIIVEFLYLALLQVVGIVLAIQTRKVKVKILNDSKYIAALIYISSIVLVTRAVAVFAVPNLLNVREAIFSGGILVISTAFLSLVFIPKIADLIKDPQGEKIFSSRGETELTTSLAFTRKQSTAEAASEQQARINQLEEKVSELEMKLREQESLLIFGEQSSGKPEHESLSLDIQVNNGAISDSEQGSRPPTELDCDDRQSSGELLCVPVSGDDSSREVQNGQRGTVTICEQNEEHEQNE